MNRRVLASLFGVLACASLAGAQCAAPELGGNCFLSSVGKYDPSYAPSPSLAPAPAEDGSREYGPKVRGAVGVAAGGYVAAKVGYGISAKAASVAHVGQVGSIPVYGSAIQSIPVIGTTTAYVGVPTTLGQMPFIGKTVASVPVVGPVVAGPPNPIVVGAVAIDTFVLPKVSPTGYTESSMFTMTDFNSPPRLLHYKNYLAPLPYTHPPIYGPAARGANFLPASAQAEIAAEASGSAVSIEH